eukprot:TRINITY_DN62861_c0_g1_i1.p1 TRINITY_DN62861_c0_g1~~TRINITY_DN62861_c0_g1_i1.p1  ORF type:complete len:160 (-),score=23.56 TRINITY_DN62861_c0_g1_i1:219-698(-)
MSSYGSQKLRADSERTSYARSEKSVSPCEEACMQGSMMWSRVVGADVEKPASPVSATVIGHVQPKGEACFFLVQFRGDANSKIALRRYKDFEKFDRMRRAQFQDLPKLPPKSFFRRKFSKDFLSRRQEGLRHYIEAATAADPSLSDPALLEFLTRNANS